ncbi:MAG: hypothetical protein ACREBC_36305 [Pyrinomonadaceae bacterium]
MKAHYDFSKGERGKFYKPDAKINLPVYLEEEVQAYLLKQAAKKGMELSELVNDLLKRDIEIIEVGK